MHNEFTKSYKWILIIWIISSFASLLSSFIYTNYTNPNVIPYVKGITCLLASISSILTIFVVMKKLLFFTNLLLIVFPIVIFTTFFFFERRIDYIIDCIFFMITLIYFCFLFLLKLIRKDDTYLVSGIMPLMYSFILMISKSLELDRYVTLIDDGFMSIFLIIGLISGIISIPIYLIFNKNRYPKKKYVGNLFSTFCCLFIFIFGIPFATTKVINYSFDSSAPIVERYKIVDKKYSVGGRYSAGNYSVIIIYNNEECKIKLPSEEYDKYNINDYIILYRHEGVFGLPYFEYKLN